MLAKTLPLTCASFLALSTLASADSVAITATAFDGFDTSSGDFTIHGPGLSLFQSSPGGPSFIGLCNMGSFCNFTFSSANVGSFCGYCSFYSSGTFGSAVAQWFAGTITFSTPAVQFQIQQSGQIMGASADFAGTATPVSAVPEPVSLLLMSSGVAGIVLVRKRFLKVQRRCA